MCTMLSISFGLRDMGEGSELSLELDWNDDRSRSPRLPVVTIVS